MTDKQIDKLVDAIRLAAVTFAGAGVVLSCSIIALAFAIKGHP